MQRKNDHGFDDVATRARVPEGSGRSAARFTLDVIEGVDKGKRVSIDISYPGHLYVGQSNACELVLHDREVSRRHLAVEISGSMLRLMDLESTNGTTLNGVRIHDAFCLGGEVIQIGATTLRVNAEEDAAPEPLTKATAFGKLVGHSVQMRRLYPLCEKLAASDVPLVIEGETGTGKEVLAEAIHDQSARKKKPFVVFDCTAVPETLLDSALFGHERGAFTGATETRIGVFEEADGGTVLIDEIGDLDISLQSKLLRALERQEVKRVGGKAWIKVNVRVIAATRRDLDRAVQEGRFRDDLYFRLAVARIELPSLRERKGDVRVLATHFWHKLSGGVSEIPSDLLARLEGHPWPGNVRELQHAIARFVALGEFAPDIGVSFSSGDGHNPFDDVLALDLPLPNARARIVDAFERKYVERVLAQNGGNVVRAAEASGLARRYFQILRARHKATPE